MPDSPGYVTHERARAARAIVEEQQRIMGVPGPIRPLSILRAIATREPANRSAQPSNRRPRPDAPALFYDDELSELTA